MPAHPAAPSLNLSRRFPPSGACACDVCRGFCTRPGWWAVSEARLALSRGYARRMMLEISPDRAFGVLSPAFAGCEGAVASNRFADRGCTFLRDDRCALFGSGLQPLECRFCHHERLGQGPACHAALEADWRTSAGRVLVARWCRLTRVWDCLDLLGLSGLRKVG